MKSFLLSAIALTVIVLSTHAAQAEISKTCKQLVFGELSMHEMRPKEAPTKFQTINTATHIRYEIKDVSATKITETKVIEIVKNDKGYVFSETLFAATTKLQLTPECKVEKIISPSGLSYREPDCDKYSRLEDSIKQKNIEIKTISTAVNESNSYIAEMKAEKSKVPSEESGEYDSQIKSAQLELLENKQIKKDLESEIQTLKKEAYDFSHQFGEGLGEYITFNTVTRICGLASAQGWANSMTNGESGGGKTQPTSGQVK